MFEIYYIESSYLDALFDEFKKRYRVFSPVVALPAQSGIYRTKEPETEYRYVDSSSGQPLIYNAYRPVEPLKSFFTYPVEKLNEYFKTEKSITEIAQKTVIFGVKGCDLAGHKIQDFVFLEGVEVDSLYRLRRENTIFISSDCTGFKEVCHCLAWEIMPYPVEGFDLNLSPLNDGYLAEVGSARGEEIVREYSQYFTLAKDVQISARRDKRANMVERLKRHLLPQNLVTRAEVQKLVKDGYNLDTWRKFMLTCVECGGCNLICDTCHCFLLSDRNIGGQNTKVRQWDCCQYANFARVAGGANPMRTRTQRLRNRFLKKFDFFVDNLGMQACCGCGRCIEVCPGKIDIREVLKDLKDKLKSQAKE